MKKENDVKTIMLIITERCNLNCSYCFEHSKSGKRMSLDTAKRIVTEELQKNDGFQKVMFEFFGGEPFLEFGLIKSIYEYIMEKSKEYHKSVLCFATTNGALIHGEIKKWLAERADHFICAVSLDGTRDVHNMTRDGSYDMIDIEFFANTYPKQACKMTVNEDTLPYLADSVISLHGYGFPVTATFAQGICWNRPDRLDLLKRELSKLVKYYIEHPDVHLCEMLDKKLDAVLFEYSDYPKWCGCGMATKAYDTHGNYYPCQAFAPQSIGEKSEYYKNTTTERFFGFEDESCQGCEWLPICPTCYGANFQKSGDYKCRDKDLCEMYQLCIAASSVIQFERLMMRADKNHLNEKEFLTLKAIERIQSTIS